MAIMGLLTLIFRPQSLPIFGGEIHKPLIATISATLFTWLALGAVPVFQNSQWYQWTDRKGKEVFFFLPRILILIVYVVGLVTLYWLLHNLHGGIIPVLVEPNMLLPAGFALIVALGFLMGGAWLSAPLKPSILWISPIVLLALVAVLVTGLNTSSTHSKVIIAQTLGQLGLVGTVLMYGFSYRLPKTVKWNNEDIRHHAANSLLPLYTYIAFGLMIMISTMVLMPGMDSAGWKELFQGTGSGQSAIIGLQAGVICFATIIASLPGLLLAVARRDHSQMDVLDHREIGAVPHYLKRMHRLWGAIRKRLSVPGAYGILFSTMSFAILLSLVGPLTPHGLETVVILVCLAAATICFLSLRAVVMTTVLLVLGYFFVLNIAGYAGLVPGDMVQRLAVFAAGAMTLPFLSLPFRDVSDQSRYSRTVINLVIIRAYGPFFMMAGIGILIFLAVGVAGLWPYGIAASAHFAMMMITTSALFPMAVIVLTTRYGRY